ncbi:hypothetical protein N0Y54_25385 [Nostoc punctiforme UO1]|uniref:hypothetical protein n=1 Tax=Nostoc punctiforme TaxID=272131 RepID=UPI0030A548C2
MKRNPTLPPYLCWVTRSLHPTYKTSFLLPVAYYLLPADRICTKPDCPNTFWSYLLVRL